MADRQGIEVCPVAGGTGGRTLGEYKSSLFSGGLEVQHDPEGLTGRGLLIGIAATG